MNRATEDMVSTQAAVDVPSHTSQRILISANPYSGRKDNDVIMAKLVETLQAHGLEGELMWSLDDCRDALADPAVRENTRCILIAGGDGTIANILSMNHHRLPIATMPLGNENLFAKEFGHCLNVEKMAAGLVKGKTRSIDLGQINQDRIFTLMVSAGFDAEVVRRVARWRAAPGNGKLRRIRTSSYILPTVNSLMNYRYPKIKLIADGETFEGHFAAVFNIPRYGGNFNFTPGAPYDDGKLDWVLTRKPGLFHVARYAALVKLGQHQNCKGVIMGRAKEVQLTCDQPAPLQADGDAIGHTPVTLNVKREIQPVIVVD